MTAQTPATTFVQDNYLDTLKRARKEISIFLHNGIHLRGTIVAFDKHVVFLAGFDRSTQLIYKHRISTIHESVGGKPTGVAVDSTKRNDHDSIYATRGSERPKRKTVVTVRSRDRF